MGSSTWVRDHILARRLTTSAIEVTACFLRCLGTRGLPRSSIASLNINSKQKLTLTSIGPTEQVRKYKHICTKVRKILGCAHSNEVQDRSPGAACAEQKKQHTPLLGTMQLLGPRLSMCNRTEFSQLSPCSIRLLFTRPLANCSKVCGGRDLA